MPLTNPIAIRLAGGLGEHLLGMRTLSFAHARMPDRPIVIYSDGGHDPVAPTIAALSPLVSDVRPMDSYDGVDGLIDASGRDLLTNAAATLRVPLFDVLAARPVLTLPDWATMEADRLLSRTKGSSFVGVCFASDDPETATPFESRIGDAISLALGSPDTVALNFAARSTPDSRIVSCADVQIEIVAALLTRCRYFVGSNNDIKHLAWALDIPRTFFVKERPTRLDILRWMPDVHRMLPFDCSDERLRRHLRYT